MRGFTGAVFCLGLSACATFDVPPQPVLPAVDVASANFANATLSDQSDGLEPDSLEPGGLETVPDWWTRFDDPSLVALIERALSENRDLSVAKANVAVADALLRRANMDRSFSTSGTTNANFNNQARFSNIDLNVSGGLGASWELDAFGRIDAQIRAATFNQEAVLQARRDVAVLVASQTAQAYIDLRSAEARLAVAKENAALQAEGLDLLNQLVEAGRSNDLDLNRSQALYLATRASLPTFQAAVATAKAQLNALTGAYAGKNGLALPASQNGKIPEHGGAFITGSPAALIRRRPDIRAAEARIGERLSLSDVERARLFPTLVINADVNGFFGSLNRLANANGFGLGIGPALSWEGPDLRRVRADINVSDAQTLSAYAAYEQTIFTALSEVETALARYNAERLRRDDLTSATDAARNALKLARLRFDEGLDDFLDVLDAQRTLLDAQDTLVQNETLITTFAISAYRALGGMWSDTELDIQAGVMTNTAVTPDAIPVESQT